jgi:hypothetical protein
LHKNRSKRQQLARFDYVGFVLFTGGLAIFLIGLSWGEGSYPWKSAHVIATIVSILHQEISIRPQNLSNMNLGDWCYCTHCVRRVRCIHPQRRSSFAHPLVHVTRISCYGHHGDGGIVRLLFNERHLAAANCLLVPWHADS